MHTPQSMAYLSHKFWKRYLLSPKEAGSICKGHVAPCFRIPFSKQDMEFSTSSANSHAVLSLQKWGLGIRWGLPYNSWQIQTTVQKRLVKISPFCKLNCFLNCWPPPKQQQNKAQVPPLCSPVVNIPSEVCTTLHLQQSSLIQGTGIDVNAMPIGCSTISQGLVVLGKHTGWSGCCNGQF